MQRQNLVVLCDMFDVVLSHILACILTEMRGNCGYDASA